MEFFENLYEKWMVIQPYTTAFSSQAVIATAFIIALINSLRKALANKELFSNFVTIAFVCANYLITALLMEYVLAYVSNHSSAASAQNIYLVVTIINLATLYFMYKAHLVFSFVFSKLFFAVVKLFIILSAFHFVIWVKFVVLDLQQEFVQIHYVYSFIVLYISLVLSFIMLFPDVLRTKFGCIVTFSLPRDRNA